MATLLPKVVEALLAAGFVCTSLGIDDKLLGHEGVTSLLCFLKGLSIRAENVGVHIVR